MKKTKLPRPTRMIYAALAAFWIAGIIHPGFNPIAVMLLLFIPVLIIEIMYPQPDLESLVEKAQNLATIEPPVSGELVDDGPSADH